ncbi:poly hydrolase [Exophiala viscosa]|uniref:Poly hydrolase n=1 Tax=Exophiala viscosa TaxID=2486360 RepID=A0AAN6DSA4_9EURO|nr:poly hydrolase [Exophiala viscosa]
MADLNTFSTAQVPPQFLKSAFLVGKIPFRTCRSHPSVCYTLYIPPHAYNPDPSRTTDGNPAYSLPCLPLIVSIHGTGRNAENCRDRLIDFADKEHVAVLAPLFPAGSDGPSGLDGYKVLRAKGLNSDLVLLDILDEIEAVWPGISTQKIFLTGFSGGGQFALRFLYIHPQRVKAVSIGAPGRATLLSDQEWPRGVGNIESIFGAGTMVDIEKIQVIPIQLNVGSEDNYIHGGDDFWAFVQEMKANLRKSGAIDPQAHQDPGLETMKEGRLDALTRLRDSWESHGIHAALDIVPGIAHESIKALPMVLEFLQPQIEGFRRAAALS